MKEQNDIFVFPIISRQWEGRVVEIMERQASIYTANILRLHDLLRIGIQTKKIICHLKLNFGNRQESRAVSFDDYVVDIGHSREDSSIV